MAIFTEEQFKNIASQYSGNRGLSGVVNEKRTFSKSTATSSVFLSHSHHDKDKVEQAKLFFESQGVSIYVDWMDETMPTKTNEHTANTIKVKIRGNKKFVLLATNLAVNSKWCNWEVGIGDIYKYDADNIAILGMADNQGHWSGNEYLKIYLSIEFVKGNPINNLGQVVSDGYYVFWPADSNNVRNYVPLKVWLAT
jgi:hypothetical protein